MSHIYGDMGLLHPVCKQQFFSLKRLLEQKWRAKDTLTQFAVFETYRSPMRQMELYEQTPRVTKAGPWQSAHQYGMAVDFVPLDDKGQYSWDKRWNYDLLAECAEISGLHVPISWDRCHVESYHWQKVRKELIA